MVTFIAQGKSEYPSVSQPAHSESSNHFHLIVTLAGTMGPYRRSTQPRYEPGSRLHDSPTVLSNYQNGSNLGDDSLGGSKVCFTGNFSPHSPRSKRACAMHRTIAPQSEEGFPYAEVEM